MKNLTEITWFLALVCTAADSVPAADGDWPQWRGPNRDAVSTETGLLKDWPAGGPPLAWKANGLGSGYATVSVVGNRIFTAGETGDSSFVVALNLADGKPVWSAKIGRAGAPGGFDGPRSTPTVDGDRVWAVGQFGELACLNAATGKEHWRKDFKKDFGGTRPEWGFTESPLVDGAKVVFTPGGPQGAVVALNKQTGALIWQCKEFKDSAHYASLIAAEIGGVQQYVQLTEASVAGIMAANGKLLWRAPRRGSTAVVPTPIWQGNEVYVTSGYNIGCNLFKIAVSGGKFSAEQIYANKVMVNHHGGVVRIGDYLYGHSDNGGWTCQDLKTGRAVWQERQKLGKGSLVSAGGRLYLRAEGGQGVVALIEPTPAGYQEHGRFNQPDRSNQNSWAHPVVAGGKLYLRDQDILLCYDVRAK